MKKVGTIELKTERLILRKFCVDDAQEVFKNYASDDEATKFLRWPTHKSVQVTIDYLTNLVKDYAKNDFYNWAIVLKETNEVIGNISVVDINNSRNQAEIGYVLSKKYWNQGIMTEALKRVLSFLIDDAKVFKVYAACDSRNLASKNVMEKANMKYQETTKGTGKNNSGVCDNLVYLYDESCKLFEK